VNFFAYIFTALGGVIGGVLYDTVSPQIPFILSAILAIPPALIVITHVHEPRPEDR
jgi:predicted MFS family arabinose efflux permease